MTALAQTVLVKRVDPEARSKAEPSQRTRAFARIALWTILALCSYSLFQTVTNRRIASFASPKAASQPGGAEAGGSTPFSKAPIASLDYQDAAGWVSSHLGYYNAAISYLSEAIKKNPRDYRAYDRRAAVYWRTGRLSLAARDFENAVKINAKDTTALEGLGWLLANANNRSGRDHKRAIILARRACVLTRWHDAHALESLAAAYAAAGAFDKAIKIQGRSLAIAHSSSRSAARLALYAQHRIADSDDIP